MAAATPSFGSTNAIVPGGGGVDPFRPTPTPSIPINPTPDQLAARDYAAKGGTPSSVTDTRPNATDKNGQPAYVGNPGLNPQFNYSSVGQPGAQKREPAVLSSSTIDDQVIPNNLQTLSTLGQKGTYADMKGILRYSDGSLVPAPMDAEGGADGTWQSNGTTYGAGPDYVGASADDAEGTKINDLLGSLKSSLDSSTKRQIDAIEQNHAAEVAGQNDANTRADKARSTSLLALGTSRYAPFAASGTSFAQTSFGLQQIANLDAKENAALAQAYSAQESGNQQIVDKALGYVQEVRKEKQAAAQKIIDAQQKRLDAAQTQQIQSSRDSAISSLVQQGVTDPKKLLDYLNFDQSGNPTGDFTAAEVQTALKNITEAHPEAADVLKVIQDAAANGAPQSVLSAIGKAGSAQDAVVAAGGYLQKATGDLGDYLTYKRQAEENGENPMDYLGFKKVLADMKAKPKAPTKDTPTFSTTQSNKGAENAGIGLDEFGSLDKDTKNFFVNGYSTFAAEKKKIGLPAAKGGITEKQAADDIRNSKTIPEKAKEYLLAQLPGSGDANASTDQASGGNGFMNFLSSAGAGVSSFLKGLSGWSN